MGSTSPLNGSRTRGEFPKATQLYMRIIEQFPETQEAFQAQQVLIYLSDMAADSLYTEGMALYDRGEYKQAIEVLRQIVERYLGTPSEAAARCNIGVSYQQMGEWRKAAKVYEEAITALKGREEEWQALEFARANRRWITRTYFGEEVME